MHGHQVEGDDAAHAYDLRVVRRFWDLTTGFWRGNANRRAWLLTFGLAFCLLANVSVQFTVNTWNRWFFNALEDRDGVVMVELVAVFAVLFAIVAAVGVGIVWTRETLQVRWREWVTRDLVARWFATGSYRRLAENGIEPANPEYRIADDVRMALEPIVDFAIGLLSALLGAATFLGVLWSIGGSLTVGGMTIPAYMVLAAILYGACASLLMMHVGRPLVRRVGARNEAEASLRFALTRVRTEAAAIDDGVRARDEQAALGETYDRVVRRWLAVVRQNARITWITNGSGALIPVVPLLLAAPKYMADELTLGAVVQLVAAFVQVQVAISWIVDNYRRIAECYASVRRVVELADAIDTLDPAAEPAQAQTQAPAPLAAPAGLAASGPAPALIQGLMFILVLQLIGIVE